MWAQEEWPHNEGPHSVLQNVMFVSDAPKKLERTKY